MSTGLQEELGEALKAHGAWKHKLRSAAAAGDRGLPVADIYRPDHCRFGKWLQTVPAAEGGEHLAEVQRLHADFHRIAGDIASLIQRGRSEEALQAIDGPDYVHKTFALTKALNSWRDSV
jgi:hypothetical protein